MALPRIRVDVDANTAEAEAGLDRVKGGIQEVGAAADAARGRVVNMDRAMRKTGAGSSSLARGIQQASFQLGDFAVQVGAGTAASVALGQQLPQLLGGFGILGAVLGAAVAVAIPLTRALGSMAESGRDLGSVLGTLRPAAEAISSAFAALRDISIQAAEVILNNFDRILITAGLVAGFFAAKLVASFVAAQVAAFSLTGALVALRTALIRTGIGALVIGAGELAYQLSRLVQAAGGFSEALKLVGAVFVEVWDKMRRGASVLAEMMEGAAMLIEGAFRAAFGAIATAFNDNVLVPITKGINLLINSFNRIPGVDLGGELAMPESQAGSVGGSMMENGREVISSAGRSLSMILSEPMKSVESIRDVLRSIKEERLDLPSLLTGGGEDGEGGGGKQKSAWEQMIEDIERTKNAYAGLREAGQNTWGALGDFIQQFAGKSKAAAIAVIAIQKGLSIAQIISNTAAAQLRALAELGPIAGPPVAAKIGLFGKVQAALVAATGLMQAGQAGRGGAAPNLSGGGGGGGGGGVAAPSSGGNSPSRSVALQLVGGDLFSRTQVVQLINAINEAQEDGAVVRLV